MERGPSKKGVYSLAKKLCSACKERTFRLPIELYPELEHLAPAPTRISASGPTYDTPAGVEERSPLLVSRLSGRLAKPSNANAQREAAAGCLAAVPSNLRTFPRKPERMRRRSADGVGPDFSTCLLLRTSQEIKSDPGMALPDFGAVLAAVRVCAPSSNTGAQNTQDTLSAQKLSRYAPKPKSKREEQEERLLPVPDAVDWRFDGFLIDWLRFTVIPEDQQQQFLTSWRGEPGDWTEQNSGHMGYRRCYRSEGVSIYYDHAEEGRGICFDISGKGCRRLEEAGRVAVGAGWTNLLRTLTTTPGVSITRLDAAIDDRKGLVDLERVQQCIDTGLVVSRFKSAYSIEKQSLSTGEGCGKTINFGSRVSNLMVRMYNKAAEQKLDTGEHWTRVECEAKDENAVALAVALAEAGAHEAGTVVAGVLRNYLTFRERSETDTNKSRWPVVAWWDEFLQGVAALRLAVAKQEPTLERLRAWLEKQVAPTLALLFDREVGCYGRSLLDVLVAGGVERLRPKHHKLLDAERRRVALVAPAGGPTGF